MKTATIEKTELQLQIENLKVSDLRTLSTNWDKRTIHLLLWLSGAGNMFGGHSRLVHVTLHGENSIFETGSFTINGVVLCGYNIARGANGDNYQNAEYYKNFYSFEGTHELQPDYKIRIDGSCGGAEKALCQILDATQEWIKQ